MIDVALACNFIPGYDLITESDRTAFETTWAGDILAVAVGRIEAFNNQGWVSWLFTTETREKKIEAAQANLISQLATDDAYNALLININTWRLRLQQKEKDNTAEKNRLIALHLPHLKTACARQIPVMNLDSFNKQQAEKLATALLNSNISQWLALYEESLLNHIQSNLGLIDGKDPLKDKLTYAGIRDSLSCLLSSGVIKDGKDLFDKFADAHGFIQATGFATQNETSFLVWLDIYNYTRASGHITELKFTMNRFLQPFTPLFAEYYDITHKEHNVALQILRTIMPMLILAATVILVSAVLTQFLIPELAFIFILIPTVYIGLVLASSYVAVKDSVYHMVRSYWYGQFKISEYMVSQRMTDGFNSPENAEKVRDFYVDGINACFKKERGFRQKMAGTKDYTETEKKENTVRLGQLKLEWYDIHSNIQMDYDKIPQIILNRLRIDIKQECESIKRELSDPLKNKIRPLTERIAHEIQAQVEQKHHTHLFFRQLKCFEHKARAEKLNAMIKALYPEI